MCVCAYVALNVSVWLVCARTLYIPRPLCALLYNSACVCLCVREGER